MQYLSYMHNWFDKKKLCGRCCNVIVHKIHARFCYTNDLTGKRIRETLQDTLAVIDCLNLDFTRTITIVTADSSGELKIIVKVRILFW